jgi:protein phosphatase
MNVAIGAKSDVGMVREANEDSYLVHEPLFVVADGMGGHVAGDIASSTAVEEIRQQSDTASSDDMETLAALVRNANSKIWEKAKADPSLHGMGTTCTLLLLDKKKAHIAHVGDSRAYIWRGGKLTQLTEDHSLVGRMVKEGRLKPEEAEHHPQRSIVTRALGVDADVEVDLLSVDLNEGDRLMLCSDGLSSMTDSSSMQEVLGSEPDPQRAADRLIQLANDAGGEDNITVVVVDIGGDGASGASSTQQASRPARSHQAAGAATGAAAEGGPRVSDGAHAEAEPARRTWLKKLATVLVVLVLLATGGYFAARYFITNSWYVGVNADNRIVLFQGIPEEVGGFTFREERRVSDLSLNELPEFLRDGPKEGIKVDSLEDGVSKINDLKDQAQRQETGSPDRNTRDRSNDTQNKKKKRG